MSGILILTFTQIIAAINTAADGEAATAGFSNRDLDRFFNNYDPKTWRADLDTDIMEFSAGILSANYGNKFMAYSCTGIISILTSINLSSAAGDTGKVVLDSIVLALASVIALTKLICDPLEENRREVALRLKAARRYAETLNFADNGLNFAERVAALPAQPANTANLSLARAITNSAHSPLSNNNRRVSPVGFDPEAGFSGDAAAHPHAVPQ